MERHYTKMYLLPMCYVSLDWTAFIGIMDDFGNIVKVDSKQAFFSASRLFQDQLC